MAERLSPDDRERASGLGWLLGLALAAAWMTGVVVYSGRWHDAKVAALFCPPGTESAWVWEKPNCANIRDKVDGKRNATIIFSSFVSLGFIFAGKVLASEWVLFGLRRRVAAQEIAAGRAQAQELARRAQSIEALAAIDRKTRLANLHTDTLTRLGLVSEDIDILEELPPAEATDIERQKAKIRHQLNKVMSHDRAEDVIEFAARNLVAGSKLKYIRARMRSLSLRSTDLQVLMSRIPWWRR